MKKIFIIIFLGLFLVSCFGSSENNGLMVYEGNENFSLKIPEKWDILDKKSGEIPNPRSGELELSVRSKSDSNSFYNNLIILSEKVKNKTSAGEYVISANLLSEKKFFEYKKIEEKDFSFENGAKSKIVIFEARYDEKTPKVKFLQTANICSDKNYHVTLAIDNSNVDTKKYEYMLSSFKCKK